MKYVVQTFKNVCNDNGDFGAPLTQSTVNVYVFRSKDEADAFFNNYFGEFDARRDIGEVDDDYVVQINL